MNKIYACIDLKSFYASCECVEKGLDPLKTNLVVADPERTEKTICLAVTPSLKKYGISGRARLFEVIQKVKEINLERKIKNKNRKFIGKSYNSDELESNSALYLDYIIAQPRMSLYIKYSTLIYNIYLSFLSKEDIYVYSIDEVFCDITPYLSLYKKNSNELISMIISEIYKRTGITATGGIGTNPYLAKVAMDIVAKHKDADKNGARIAFLDEISYRKTLWNHEPISDFWRIGNGIAKRIKKLNLNTMGDIAKFSISNEDELYKMFGINAELIIDHAWGYEPCTIKDIKSYKPRTNSLSKGQVLQEPYTYEKAKIIAIEMMELLSLEMVGKNVVTDCLVLTIGYDISNLTDKNISKLYDGEIKIDHYGREIPKHSHGTIRLTHKTSSTETLIKYLKVLYKEITNPLLLIRRINICACVLSPKIVSNESIVYKQFNLFDNNDEINKRIINEKEKERDENKVQKAILNIKNKYGKNSILKGFNLLDGATTIMRNKQIGGHRSE